MPPFNRGSYTSPWLLRSQENLRNPNPLVMNKPVVRMNNNNNSRKAFAPVRAIPKRGRRTRKMRKGRKAGTRRR